MAEAESATRARVTRRALLGGGALWVAGAVAGCVPVPAAPAPTPGRAPAAASPTPSPAPTIARPLDVVKQGNLAGISYGTFIARERGYFRELGIDSQEEIFTSGAQQTPALASGQIEIGTTSIQSAHFNAVSRGIQQRMVVDNAHMERGVASSVLAVRADLLPPDGVLPLAEIRGRAIATSTDLKQGGMGFAVARMLATVGLTIEDVDWKIVPFVEMPEVVANRGVDGAIFVEPFYTLAAQRVPLALWQNLSDFYPGQQTAALVYSERFIAERPDVARRWMVANLRGIRDLADWIRRGQPLDEIAAILARNTRLTPELVTKVNWLPLNPDGYLNTEAIEADQRQLLEWGSIRELIPIEVLVDHQFVDYAVAQLGRYRW